MTPHSTVDLKSTNYPGASISTNSNSTLHLTLTGAHAWQASSVASQRDCCLWRLRTQLGRWEKLSISSRPQTKGGRESPWIHCKTDATDQELIGNFKKAHG